MTCVAQPSPTRSARGRYPQQSAGALRCVLRQRLGALSAVLAAAVALPAFAALPALSPAAAANHDDVKVRLSGMTPAVVTPGAVLTVRGEVHNPNRHLVSDARVYAAIPASPFASHQQAATALAAGTADTGPRLLDADLMDDLGNLKPGATKEFSLTIPYDKLGISGAEGVYSFSAHVSTGGRGSSGHATTLLPLRPSPGTPAPLSVLWPFLNPPGRLARAVEPGGQLRNLLDLARATPRRGSDILIDPALLARARSLADADPDEISQRKRRDARDFLRDLVRLTRDRECWATGYDRPDHLALEDATSELRDAVKRATDGTLAAFKLRCGRLEWPSAAGMSRNILAAVHDSGAQAAVVTRANVPTWDGRSGSVLSLRMPSGSFSLLVDDPVDAEAAGDRTALTLRQRILSEATWSSLNRADGRDDTTVLVVEPRWNPGTSGRSHLKVAMDNKYVDAMGFDEQVEERRPPYTGAVQSRAKPRPVSLDQIAAAVDAAHTQRLLRRVVVEEQAQLAHDQRVAAAVSQRWRGNRGDGEDYARDVNDDLHDELGDVSVEGPGALTLSSSKGRFPVTVINRTDHQVLVGLLIESTNPNVAIKLPTGTAIEAGESRTVTASIDMDGQSAATVSIHLTTSDGTILGAPFVFNVRSSRVGAALWVAIGLSVAFVAIALVRRFARPGHRPEPVTLEPDDELIDD